MIETQPKCLGESFSNQSFFYSNPIQLLVGMLKVEDLWVKASDRTILKEINLEVEEGEIIALLGPNGSGKSSLLHTLMGNPKYKVVRGRILFGGKDITSAPTDERARMGMGIAMQIPPKLKGIKLIDLLATISKRYRTDLEETMKLASMLGAEKLLERDLHDGFSGGEMKRAEILLLAAQRPKLSLLDEPDSGVDIESLPVLGKAINEVLIGGNRASERNAGIIVTHTGQILRYIPSVNRAFIILNGQVKCFGDPSAILRDIERYGFEGCVNCRLAGGEDGAGSVQEES